ncbi:S-4TM family putative pore-forming effector [Actinoplanes sp. L3-i22]|uniref:S-4TM family putative pore-forming effector n=1 Tax=Actinoplanes sp. L3-i22 TaxID=2836373 RepID=UPI001C84F065|nr:S-4TM family putative pore-forming effector [Actinoplanes sp. L3-i22]
MPEGSSARITQRQDESQHLDRLLAYSRDFQIAHRWRRARALGTFALAAVGPFISLFFPATTDLVAAISAGWLVLGRTLLTGMEQRATQHAARVQELYDTNLFHMPWNTALAGRKPAPEDVAASARHITDDSNYRNWYSVDLGTTPWPADALLCQRQSMVWSRQEHRAYSATILTTGVIWFIIGLAIALVRDISLADYLIKIFLPSAPAFLDTIELARQHWQHSNARQQAEHKIDDLWQAYIARPDALAISDCRQVQDAAFLLRRDGPRVPNLFYKIRRAKSEANTKAGTVALLSEGSAKHP